MNLSSRAELKNLSTEYRVLIALINGGQEQDLFDKLREINPDWLPILCKATKEGIFYPLYRNLLLIDANKQLLPDEIREKFRQTYYLYISKSVDQLRRAEHVLGRLESRKIKTLLFKGPAIDNFIYDGFLRPRLDLDISVRDKDLSVLENALHNLGYTYFENEKDYPIPEYLNSRLFIPHADGLIPLHLHKHLINNMYLTVDLALSMDMENVWDEVEPFKNYQYIFMLKPELNIIYLCEHGLKHDFDQIVFLYEIESLIRYYQGRLDWKKLVALAQGFGLGRAVYYGLYFLKEVLLSADIPPEVIEGLKPKRFSAGERMFIKKTLAKKHRRYLSFPVYLAMRRGLFKKANFVFRTIFPPGFTTKGYLVRLARSILS